MRPSSATLLPPVHLADQLTEFVKSAIVACAPRWIIPVERKGTALLRCYVESTNDAECAVAVWKRTLSSSRLDAMPDGALQDGNILLLDEGTYHGVRLGDTVKKLLARGVDQARIKVAVFAVHESSAYQGADYRWFGQLSEDTYRQVRHDIVRLFQRKGSLLLDTEHLEVSIDLNCGRLEFFDALCRTGVGVEYVSPAGRVNLTVVNPLLVDEPGLLAVLPPGTRVDNVVRKFRVVERGPNRFAILPIFFPSIPVATDSTHLAALHPAFRDLSVDSERTFQLVALYSGLHLLQSAVMSLRDLIASGRISVALPESTDSDDGFGHLVALFPEISLDDVRALAGAFVEQGRTLKPKGLLKRPHRLEIATGTDLDTRLSEFSRHLLDRIFDETIADPGNPLGVTLARLLSGLKVEDEADFPLISTAIDRLIDDAQIVPVTRKARFPDGVERFVRGFRLDGEVVTSDVRRLRCLWRHRRTLNMRPSAASEEMR